MRLSEIYERCLNAHYQQAARKVHYAIERAGDTLWLFFEHSRDTQDWFYNFDFPIRPYQRMGDRKWYCHRGFLTAWKQVEKRVSAAVALGAVRRVIIAGYSHGAALAVLCHEYIWYHVPALRQELFGFGFACPRVVWGQAPWERWSQFVVIRNRGDPVPHLPPALLGYRHVGQILTVGEKGNGIRLDAHLPAAMKRALKGNKLLFSYYTA